MFWDTVITSAGVSAATVCIVGWLVKIVIQEHVRNAIKAEYEQQIETHKATLKVENDAVIEHIRTVHSQIEAMQTSVFSSWGRVYHAAQERRLDAIQTFWRAMVRLGQTTSGALTMGDIFTEREYEDGTAFRTELMQSFLGNLSEETLAAQLAEDEEGVQEARAFATEYMYGLFFAYRALIGRVTGKMLKGFKNGAMQPWYKDKGIRELLSVMLNSEELNRAEMDQGHRFLRIREAIENRMLSHMSDIASGTHSAESMLAQARKIRETVMDKMGPLGLSDERTKQ